MAFLFATMGQKPGGVSIVFLVVAALWAFVNGIALYYGSMLAFASQVAMVILVPLVTRSPLDGMLGLMTVGLLTIFSRSREHMFGE